MAPDESTAEDATEDVPVAPEGSEAADPGEEASAAIPTPAGTAFTASISTTFFEKDRKISATCGSTRQNS